MKIYGPRNRTADEGEERDMSVKVHIDQHRNQMELMGGIFTALNRLENGIINVISSAFIDPNFRTQEKSHFIRTHLKNNV